MIQQPQNSPAKYPLSMHRKNHCPKNNSAFRQHYIRLINKNRPRKNFGVCSYSFSFFCYIQPENGFLHKPLATQLSMEIKSYTGRCVTA